VVKYLVKHGANINKENVNGITPLYYARIMRREIIVQYLIEHGAI